MNGTNERKGSDGSSEKSGTKGNTDSKSTKSNNEVTDMQKKMKILKDALLKERQEKDVSVKSKKDVEKELERTKTQLQEKENYLLKLKDEVADLQTKLQIEKKRAESQQPAAPKPTDGGNQSHLSDIFSSSMTGLSSVFGIKKGAAPEDLQKIQQENNYAKMQLQVAKEKLTKAEEMVAQVKKEANQQAEGTQKKMKDLEKDLETRIQAYRELNQKFEELNNSVTGLKKDKERLEQEKNRLRSENDSLTNERDELEKEQTEKAKIIQELNEVCQKMEKELSNQVSKVTELTNKLNETELKMQVFDLKKAGKIMDTPALIMMRKNVNGEYLIEIESEGDKLLLYPQVIQSFGPIKETEDRFYLDYNDPKGVVQRDVFQAEDRKKILRSLKTFVKLAESNRANANNNAKTAIKEKNLLSQMVSFFNN